MDFYTITSAIMAAAGKVGVSSSLLLAVCNHESGGFKLNYAPDDNGSPSYGICQVKEESAKMFGFKGDPEKLMDPKVNTYYAARYLKYQESRYGNDWVKLVAAYNSGTYFPGKKFGCPKNLGYLKLVKKKLPEGLQHRLDCGVKK